MTTRLDISDLVGAPFAWNGRGPAFDCFGLLLECSRRLGLDPPDYQAKPNDGETNAAIVAAGLGDGWREIARPTAGCAVLFRGSEPHVGVMLAGERFLHTRERIGQAVVERLSHPFWSRSFAGFYEYAGGRADVCKIGAA